MVHRPAPLRRARGGRTGLLPRAADGADSGGVTDLGWENGGLKEPRGFSKV